MLAVSDRWSAWLYVLAIGICGQFIWNVPCETDLNTGHMRKHSSLPACERERASHCLTVDLVLRSSVPENGVYIADDLGCTCTCKTSHNVLQNAANVTSIHTQHCCFNTFGSWFSHFRSNCFLVLGGRSCKEAVASRSGYGAMLCNTFVITFGKR
jgi:hypothetical protein